MSTNAIARRYAKALIQIAVGQKSVELYNTELTAFSQALASSPEATALLSDPGMRIDVKRELLKEMISRLGISKTISDFILLLLDKKRLYFLSQIASSYRSFADEAAGDPSLHHYLGAAFDGVSGERDAQCPGKNDREKGCS